MKQIEGVTEHIYRDNKIMLVPNGDGHFNYYFYLMDEDEEIIEYGPYEGYYQAKCAMDRMLDNVG